MEASQENQGQDQDPQADPTAPENPQTGDPSAYPGTPEGQREGSDVQAVPTASDENLPPDSEERNPAYDQAPVASEAQEAVIGDPGLRDEQQPIQTEGGASAVDNPHRTSAPAPASQSGVPLPEDRAAGVEPGVGGPHVPVDEEGEGELPEHDASGGQSHTPPLGG